MRRAAFLGSMVLLSATGVHASLSVPDAVLWGSVEINGSAAPAGTVVSGRVDGVALASHVLGSDSEDPMLYSLHVPMSQPESFFDAPLPGTAFPGYSVQLFVDGRLVAEELLLESPTEPDEVGAGVLTRVDLNDTGSPPSTFTGTPLRFTPTTTPTRTPGPPTTVPTRTQTLTGATPTSVVAGSATVPPTATPTPTATKAARCAGDCDGTGRVDVTELIRSVNTALGRADLEACRAADPGDDGVVRIDELGSAVRNLVQGCP